MHSEKGTQVKLYFGFDSFGIMRELITNTITISIELLTPCYGDGIDPGTSDRPYHAAYENLDPTKEFTYQFIKELFTEIAENVTRDAHIHLGMDEVLSSLFIVSILY